MKWKEGREVGQIEKISDLIFFKNVLACLSLFVFRKGVG